MTPLTIGELVSLLAKQDQEAAWRGGDSVHSYRGYYDELAIEPGGVVTVAKARVMLEDAVGSTFQGYKGGDYTMTGDTPVWSAPYGSVGVPVIGITVTKDGVTVATGREVSW